MRKNEIGGVQVRRCAKLAIVAINSDRPIRICFDKLVVLDHGLYREIGDDFRLLFCRLWKAMVRFILRMCYCSESKRPVFIEFHLGVLFIKKQNFFPSGNEG